jgi:cell division protein FtsI/penicillin-binding protein 2
MSYHINTSIVLAFIFFILFWVIGVRYIYIKICEEHSITYEMYNIIGYNLRKEIDAAK